MSADLYYCDFDLISAVPTVRFNCYYLGSNIFGFELSLYIHASGMFFVVYFPASSFNSFRSSFWDISRHFLSRLPLFLKVLNEF